MLQIIYNMQCDRHRHFHLWPCGLIGHAIRPLPVNQGRVPQRARILKQSIPEFDL